MGIACGLPIHHPGLAKRKGSFCRLSYTDLGTTLTNLVTYSLTKDFKAVLSLFEHTDLINHYQSSKKHMLLSTYLCSSFRDLLETICIIQCFIWSHDFLTLCVRSIQFLFFTFLFPGIQRWWSRWWSRVREYRWSAQIDDCGHRQYIWFH